MRAYLVGFLVILVFAVSPAQAESVSGPLSLLVVAKSIAGPAVSKSLLVNKPVVVTFFASWCPPCLPEFMTLNALKKHPDAQGVTIIVLMFLKILPVRTRRVCSAF